METGGSIAIKSNLSSKLGGFKPALWDCYEDFFQEEKKKKHYFAKSHSSDFGPVAEDERNKRRKGRTEPSKSKTEAEPFKSYKVIKSLKWASFNGKRYATLIICHLPCKIQIKHKKDKILTQLFYHAKHLGFTTPPGKRFTELQLFSPQRLCLYSG